MSAITPASLQSSSPQDPLGSLQTKILFISEFSSNTLSKGSMTPSPSSENLLKCNIRSYSASSYMDYAKDKIDHKRRDLAIRHWGCGDLWKHIQDPSLATPLRMGALVAAVVRGILWDLPATLAEKSVNSETALAIPLAIVCYLWALPGLYIGALIGIATYCIPITDEDAKEYLRSLPKKYFEETKLNFEKETTTTSNVRGTTINVFNGTKAEKENLLNEIVILKKTLLNKHPEMNFEKQEWFNNLGKHIQDLPVIR